MVLIGSFAGAQATSKSDIKVLALEAGTGVAYNIATLAFNSTQTFTAVYGLNDLFQVGFTIIRAAAATDRSALLRVSVFPINNLAVNLFMEADGNAAFQTGLGASYNIFTNIGTGLTTILQIHLEYLFINPITARHLAVGVNLKAGI